MIREYIKNIVMNKKIYLLIVLGLTLCFSVEIFLLNGYQKFQRTSNQIENHYRAQVYLNQVYYDDGTGNFQYKPLYLSDFQRFGTSNYVNYYSVRGTTFVTFPNLKIPDTLSQGEDVSGLLNMNFLGERDLNQRYHERLVKGKLPEKNRDCLISRELANLNQLKVGDQLTAQTEDGQKIKLTISGIILDSRFESIGLILPTNAAETIFKNDTSFIYWDAFFTLKDQKTIKQFEAQLRQQGLPLDYRLSTNQDFGDALAEPLREAQAQFGTGLLLILTVSLILLIVISLLSWKKREQKLVYRFVIGYSKPQLLGEYIFSGGLVLLISWLTAFLLNLRFSSLVGEQFLSWHEKNMGLDLDNLLNSVQGEVPDSGNLLEIIANLTIRPAISWEMAVLFFSYLLLLMLPIMYQVWHLNLRDYLAEGSRIK